MVDTHALVWAWRDPALISARARTILLDGETTPWVSAVSAYELELKRGRDAALADLPADIEAAAREDGFAWLTVDATDMAAAGASPRLHGDPWDRIIIAQARRRGWPILTADRRIAEYDAPILW